MLLVTAAAGMCFAVSATSALADPALAHTPGGAVPCQADALIEAITAANSAGGGTLRLSPGCRYTLTHPQPNTDSGLPPIVAPITINGSGATITRSTAANTPEFQILEILGAPARLTIRLTTISNGISIGDQVPGGGHSGGGILVREGGALAAAVITVTGNSGFVGGIHNYGTTQLTDSGVTGNTGAWGGGLNNTGGTLNVVRTLIRDNVTESDIGVGGGIYNSQGGTTTVTGSVISRNLGINNGGGIHNEGSLGVRDSWISQNRAASLFGAPVVVQGGGIYNAGTARIVRSLISGNHSQRQQSPTATTAIAGGIYNDGTENQGVVTTLQRTLVVGNTAVDRPGGISNAAGVFNLDDSLVVLNTPTNCAGSPDPVPDCSG